MDRLISLEPSNQVPVRVEQGQKCSGQLVLRNVMFTMPVAFRIEPVNKARYVVRPSSGIIAPLATMAVEFTYLLPLNSALPDSIPRCDDPFLLHSVVVPSASSKERTSTVDSVPSEWFSNKKKQVFTDSGIRVFFVGSAVLTRLMADGSMDSVREVLEKSDPEWRAVDSVDSTGRTLLHLAIARSRPDLVQLLLEFDPNVEATDRAGRSPLEAAAAAGETLIAELLLSRRASTERSRGSEFGPLHLAASAGHAEVLRLLILKGASVDAPAADGRTALRVAVEGRRRECVKLLLAAGARADARGGADGGTPLHAAVVAGDEAMVRLLLSRSVAGAKEVRNAAGRTAYDLAAEGNHMRMLDALKLGDDLAAAARKGDPWATARMVEQGAAVNGQDQHGWTALMRAAFKGKVETMQVLIEKGAEVEARDEEGYTALHCAAEAGHAEAVEALLKRGADAEARTAKGATAAEIAAVYGNDEVLRVLGEGGAPPPQDLVGVGKGGGKDKAEKKGKVRESRRRGRRIGGGALAARIGGRVDVAEGEVTWSH
ncbi:protein VAPYRIN-like [Curcuma longa]|uniref:protein VAPYRIN-like n=1 Tax=Curcuma longa TaxID=136217 RepID=UPI003D9F0685